MAYTHEEVMAILGDEAQAVPGAIVVFRDKHIEVAKLRVGGGFELTVEGRELLDAMIPVDAPEKHEGKKSKKVGKAPVDAAPVVDDLDLD